MTREEFIQWWEKFSLQLSVGDKIQYWNHRDGLNAGTFVVRGVSDLAITIEGKEDRIYQRIIPIRDFWQVLIDWRGYKFGTVPRKSIDARTKHSTYIISLIWSFEQGRLGLSKP